MGICSAMLRLGFVLFQAYVFAFGCVFVPIAWPSVWLLCVLFVPCFLGFSFGIF
jgi:hypothetical protein